MPQFPGEQISSLTVWHGCCAGPGLTCAVLPMELSKLVPRSSSGKPEDRKLLSSEGAVLRCALVGWSLSALSVWTGVPELYLRTHDAFGP